jgi:phage terminase small subunit
MAGVKGKSGGPRKNAGGARPGAGRKPKEKAPPPLIEGNDTLRLLQDIAFGRIPDATNIQVRAAIAAVQYTHTKKGDGGKKEEKDAAAKKVAGRFTTAAPPKLVAAGGKKV